jgi:hypothetical protein
MKITAFLLCLFVGFSVHAQNMGVGTTTPDASAVLDVSSANKGLLIPRMTATTRTSIPNPATGLMVFQTDGSTGFYYNAGTPAAPSWILLQPSTNVTAQGNTFNGVNQLVKTDLSGQLPALSGANLTSLNASNLSSGNIPIERLGNPEAASSATFLRGDNTWVAPTTFEERREENPVEAKEDFVDFTEFKNPNNSVVTVHVTIEDNDTGWFVQIVDGEGIVVATSGYPVGVKGKTNALTTTAVLTKGYYKVQVASIPGSSIRLKYYSIKQIGF